MIKCLIFVQIWHTGFNTLFRSIACPTVTVKLVLIWHSSLEKEWYDSDRNLVLLWALPVGDKCVPWLFAWGYMIKAWAKHSLLSVQVETKRLVMTDNRIVCFSHQWSLSWSCCTYFKYLLKGILKYCFWHFSWWRKKRRGSLYTTKPCSQ